MHPPMRASVQAMVATLVAVAAAVSAPAAPQKQLRSERVGSMTVARLGFFLDSLLTAELAREDVPGAAFVLVKDGRVVYEKGFGWADVEGKRRVDPKRTLWRIGSITKTFTATAVAQLADRGTISLRADANRYLRRLQIQPAYSLPVTVSDLLTHTSGFDEINPGRQAPSREAILPLPQFLKGRLVRVRPPGRTISYSTYGIAVAAVLVEDVSGDSLEVYWSRNIWRPLGMKRTCVDDLPLSWAPDMAVGYSRRGDSLVIEPWEWYHTWPASSITTTAADMARYMAAHLQGGRLGSQRILSEAGEANLLRQHATMHSRIPGVTLGFWEDYVGDLRVVEHGGNMAGFSSQMVLVPSEGIGFFLVNHFEGSHLRDQVKWTLLRALFPAARVPRPVPEPPPDFESRAKAYEGQYIPTNSCFSCVPVRASMVLEVKAKDGALEMLGNRWIECDPLLFVQREGSGYIAFRTDTAGVVTELHPGSFWSFSRAP
jgi:CubicO group peptidase (beta-lactamase class C family)